MSVAVSMGNIPSQLERAIAAFLLANGCGTVDDVSPGRSLKLNTYPLTIVKTAQGSHDPQNTGTMVCQVQLQFKQSAINEKGEPNPGQAWVEFDARIGAAMAQMLQSNDGNTFDYTAHLITVAGRALAVAVTDQDDPDGAAQAAQIAANNADMADFTLTHLYYKGYARGVPDDEASAWMDVHNFECHACAVNCD